jgi:hypothetical protein
MSDAIQKAERAASWLDRKRAEQGDRPLPYRILWIVAAVIVTAAGIAMIVLPGPALILIPVGLAMLSFEFAWAARAARGSLRGAAAVEEFTERKVPDRRLRLAAGALALTAVVAFGLLVVL